MVSHHPKEATKEAGCNECASVAHALSSVVQSSSDSVCKGHPLSSVIIIGHMV